MIQTITKIFILSAVLISALMNNLYAGQEPKVKESPKQPYAYIFPKKLKKLTEHLQREEIDVCELREDLELDIEVFHITKVVRDKKAATEVTTECRQETRRFRAGTILVKANQKSQDKVESLLDPNSKIRKEKRKLFGRLKKDNVHPVVRLNEYVPITHGPVQPLKEKRQFNRPITFEALYEAKKINFSGSPVSRHGVGIAMQFHECRNFDTYASTNLKNSIH